MSFAAESRPSIVLNKGTNKYRKGEKNEAIQL